MVSRRPALRLGHHPCWRGRTPGSCIFPERRHSTCARIRLGIEKGATSSRGVPLAFAYTALRVPRRRRVANCALPDFNPCESFLHLRPFTMTSELPNPRVLSRYYASASIEERRDGVEMIDLTGDSDDENDTVSTAVVVTQSGLGEQQEKGVLSRWALSPQARQGRKSTSR